MARLKPAADPWAQLAELAAAAPDYEPGRAVFGAALRDFHAAGWTYRQLGEATGVSHEFVRLAIAGLPPEASSGIKPPRRPKSLSVIPVHELDPRIADGLLRALAATEQDTGDRTASGLKPAVADYFAALHAATEAGWDAYSIAAGIGSHPKAVFKFIAFHERYGDGTSPALPAAPHRDEPILYRARRPSLPLVTIPDSAVQELHRLDPEAFSATAGAASRYQALLGEWYLRGANRQELERGAGQQWETVRKRLVSAGYMGGKPRAAQRPG